MSKRTEEQKMIDDEKIIELYWRREERAIQETDKKYGRLLFRIAYNFLHDRPDCEECQNDTYLAVWNKIPPTRPTAFRAFITQIVRRIAINRYNEKMSQKRIPSELTVSMEDLSDFISVNDGEEEFMAEEIGKIINAYVRQLDERQRYIFVSRFYVAESVENIARELSVVPSTVYRALDQIKYGLKECLERNGVQV